MFDKLLQAFELTGEKHAEAFERFANAFLVDDFPELSALGGKKDKGMDARIFADDTGKVILVVQSCVSPSSKARTKILDTIKKLLSSLPETFIYCTSSTIGLALDETKNELRQKHKVALQHCDAAWFNQRSKTSVNRAALCETFSSEILNPYLADVQPDRLYHLLLNEEQERKALQYLEAVNLDRARDSNITKGIFDSLIIFVTKDSEPPAKVFTEINIIDAICKMFPNSHAIRIKEIVPGRIKHLSDKNRALHYNQQAGGLVLSFKYREIVKANIQRASERELTFRAELKTCIEAAIEAQEIDYDAPVDILIEVGHSCVLWYFCEQGKALADTDVMSINILNAERLVDVYLESVPLTDATTKDAALDILPHALFKILNSRHLDVKKYLRSKADLFIVRSFMQVTPDVQDACRKLLTGDILFLDSSILVRCIADLFSPTDNRSVLRTLESAKKLGYQLRTWRCYVEELVAHLQGPTLLEWKNHYQGLSSDKFDAFYRAAPALIRVFIEYSKTSGLSFPDIVDTIIGRSNEIENTIEYLKQELLIDTLSFHPRDHNIDTEWKEIYDFWIEGKNRYKNMAQDRFERLVHNDVNAYTEVLRLRRENRPSGVNYGHKHWLFTFDRMSWRVARHFVKKHDSVYQVSMSLSYLMNSVATLVNVGGGNLPDELLPATTILDETEYMPAELRAIFREQPHPDEKRYQRERRIRDLIHTLKASTSSTDMSFDENIEVVEQRLS